MTEYEADGRSAEALIKWLEAWNEDDDLILEADSFLIESNEINFWNFLSNISQ